MPWRKECRRHKTGTMSNFFKNRLLLLSIDQIFMNLGLALLIYFSYAYVYRLALSNWQNQTRAISAVFIFELIFWLGKLIGNFLAEEMSQKYGLKRQIQLSTLISMVSLPFFAFSNQHFYFIWIGAALWGAYSGFYWFGHHGLWSKICLKKPGSKIAQLSSAITIVGLLTPVVCGYLVSNFGYEGIMLFSILILAASLLTLKGVDEMKTHHDVSFKELVKLYLSHKKMGLVYFSNGLVGSVYTTSLLLYLFLNLNQEAGVGLFLSLSMVIVAIVYLAAGRWVDKRGKKGLLFYGAIIMCFIWVARYFLPSLKILFILDIIYRIAIGMISIALDIISYEKARQGHSTGRAVLFREVAITSGGIFVAAATLILVWAGLGMQGSFLIAGVFSLSPLLITSSTDFFGKANQSVLEGVHRG